MQLSAILVVCISKLYAIMPMTRTILILCLLAFTSCFNYNSSKNEPEAVCGVVDDNKTKVVQPDIFKAKCATCHSFDKDLTGPKMSGILERAPSEEWLRHFITNQDSLIEIEDLYTLEIMQWSAVKWNHNSSDLKKHELDTLIGYITSS
ncbi:MAG: hypothetical protein ACJASQ_003339 [Crocinitomicaceae bacterium]|jgi:hypothetical protein